MDTASGTGSPTLVRMAKYFGFPVLTLVNAVPNMNQPAGSQQGQYPPGSSLMKGTEGSMAEKLAFFQLPPLLQSEFESSEAIIRQSDNRTPVNQLSQSARRSR